LLIDLNPATYLLAMIREPLLGRPIPLEMMSVCLGIGAVGWVITFLLLARYRHRVAYWL
jgi:lipopolysaccharide transport system permease protein